MKKTKLRYIPLMLLVICMMPVMLWANVTPSGVTLNYSENNSGFRVEVRIEQIPDSTKALEVHLPIEGTFEIEEALTKWSTDLGHAYKVVKRVGNELVIYIVAELGETTSLQLGEFTLKVDSNELNIADRVSDIKWLDEYFEEQLKSVRVTIHKEINGNTDGNKPGEDTKPEEDNKPGGGSGGSSEDDGDDTTNAGVIVKPSVTPEVNEEVIAFADTTAHWANASIQRMAARGILKGYEDGTFKPNNTITRGEFASVVVRAFELKSTLTDSVFKDVEKDKWYTASVLTLYDKQIVKGRADGSFGVQAAITTEEMAVMLSRTLESLDKELVAIRSYTGFKDEGKVSAFAMPAIKMLYEAGILHGNADGTLNPRGSATRAQVAVMIERILALQ